MSSMMSLRWSLWSLGAYTLLTMTDRLFLPVLSLSQYLYRHSSFVQNLSEKKMLAHFCLLQSPLFVELCDLNLAKIAISWASFSVKCVSVPLFIYLFIWRESKGTFKSDGERGNKINANVNGYTFYCSMKYTDLQRA